MQHVLFKNEKTLLLYDTISRNWFIRNISDNINFDLSLTNNFSSFLKIFYEDPPSFFNTIAEKVKESDLDVKIIDSLPFKETIIFCIQNGMTFWLELSLKWLDFINIDKELKEAFEKVISDPAYPQNIRHRLFNICS